MGIYDTIGKNYLQIKCSPVLNMQHYKIGDTIEELEDGLYLAYEGWFIVEDSKVKIEGIKIFDKWGGGLDAGELINPGNPVTIFLDSLENNGE